MASASPDAQDADAETQMLLPTSQTPASSRLVGYGAVLIALVSIAPDPSILRTLQAAGATNYQILVWKLLFTGLMQVAIACCRHGGFCAVWVKFFASWKWMIVGTVGGATTFAYMPAVLTTSAASALVLLHLAPLWAVALGVLVNGEKCLRRTKVALMMALSGVALIFAASFTFEVDEGQHDTRSSLFGDCLGLLAGFGFAVVLTCSRNASMECPDAPVDLAIGVGGIALGGVAMWMLVRRGESPFDVPPKFTLFLALGCAGVSVYFVLSVVAARFFTGGTLGMYLTLECALAPLVVWYFHDEVPPALTLVGCGILASAVLIHEAFALHDDSRQQL